MNLADFIVDPSKPFDLKERSCDASDELVKKSDKKLKKSLAEVRDELIDLQQQLYSEKKQSLLIVFQGMDAAGKDSTIRHVFSGTDPAGCVVHSFKRPSSEELAGTYLQRYWDKFPQRGNIAIFNRSYYEEVSTVRVHSQLLALRGIDPASVGAHFWLQRCREIAAMEEHLANANVRVLKFYLHISKDEQRRRLLRRLYDPKRNWKFEMSDVTERDFWEDFQVARNVSFVETSTPACPWYVVPADSKPVLRYLIAQIVRDALVDMDPQVPTVSAKQAEDIEKGCEILFDPSDE